ncbi:MAG: DNA recombination protein RmuC [Deltaproteobacteria bacterium]|nr:DNA recombination protein RmuC [Deltaproteobacteria bacterium]
MLGLEANNQSAVHLVFFVAGAFFGVLVVFLVILIRRKESREIARELFMEAEEEKIRDIEELMNALKDSFGALSLDALSRNTNEFLKLAHETLSRKSEEGTLELEARKQLIDQSMTVMKEDLEKVRMLITSLERDRQEKFGELAHQLRTTSEQTLKLQETASKLHHALSNTAVRGQWGERMAEDVLRHAGFIEGINYLKQKTVDSGVSRPDYTFLLPRGFVVNMDVKFPLDHYLKYIESDNDRDRERHKQQFLRDVRRRLKEVVTRDYINAEGNTLDYVIVFIPNEQVYSFINEEDDSILDEALKHKVIISSPITLYAILAVVRQAMDNFNLERAAAEITQILGIFYKQWEAFIASFDKMGKRLDEARTEYAYLTTTRRNQLERPLRQIADLRGREYATAESIAVVLPEGSRGETS